ALYAVHGQVYQSGADAFELFLAWTLMIALWTLAANFAPLWLLQIALINTTLILYAGQGGLAWLDSELPTILLCLNVLFWVAFEALPKWTASKPHPQWLVKLLVIYILTLVIVHLPARIVSDPLERYWTLALAVVPILFLGFWYGIRTRQIFYISSISFTLIILFASLMLRISEEGPMLLAIGLFIAGSIGLLTKILIEKQRQWKGQNS